MPSSTGSSQPSDLTQGSPILQADSLPSEPSGKTKNVILIFKIKMLEGVWRKGNPLTRLVGMQTSTATMENRVETP